MNETDRTNEAAVARAARSAFERSVAELDAHTRARLVRARREALQQLVEPRGRRAAKVTAQLSRWTAWVPEVLALQPPGRGAVAAAAVAAVGLGLWVAGLLPSGTAPPPERGVQLASSPDVDLLLGGDELDMLEDLEFYSWLGEQDEPPAADADGIG